MINKPFSIKELFIVSNVIIFTILLASLILIFFFNSPPNTSSNNLPSSTKPTLKNTSSSNYYWIKSGEFNLDDFCQQLLADNKIRSDIFMKIMFKLTGYDTKIKPGYYEITDQMTVMNIIHLLIKENLLNLTILEGYDIYQIDEEILKKKIISQPGEFIRFCQSSTAWKNVEKYFYLTSEDARYYFSKYSTKKIPISIEGFFYPDTYKVGINISLENLSELMIKNMYEKISSVFKVTPSNKEKFWQYLIMSSLVEKETSVLSERPLVASVLVNRLNKRMKLRFDPTIIYALKINDLYKSNLKEGKINIRKKHFSLASVYNTYYRKGLPPGPICSPTLTSFRACLMPAKTDYFFFVAKGDNSGKHNFSKDYQRHLKYIEVYKRNRRKYR